MKVFTMKKALKTLTVVLVVMLLFNVATAMAAIVRHSQQFIEYVETASIQIPQEFQISPEMIGQTVGDIKSLASEIDDPKIHNRLLETSELLERGDTAEALRNYQELMDYATDLLNSGKLNVEDYGRLLKIYSQMANLIRGLPIEQQMALKRYYISYIDNLSDKLFLEGIAKNDKDLVNLAKELRDLAYSLRTGKVSVEDVEKTLSMLKNVNVEKQVFDPDILENIDWNMGFLKNMVSKTKSPSESIGVDSLGSFVKNYVGSFKALSIPMLSIPLGNIGSELNTLAYIGAVIATLVLMYFLSTVLRKYGVRFSARKAVEKVVYKAKTAVAKVKMSSVIEAYWYAVGILSRIIPKLSHETHREYLEKVKLDYVREDFEKLTFLYEKDRFSTEKISGKDVEEALELARNIESKVLKRV